MATVKIQTNKIMEAITDKIADFKNKRSKLENNKKRLKRKYFAVCSNLLNNKWYNFFEKYTPEKVEIERYNSCKYGIFLDKLSRKEMEYSIKIDSCIEEIKSGEKILKACLLSNDKGDGEVTLNNNEIRFMSNK
jgi:Iap family predicted aminopeptidase